MNSAVRPISELHNCCLFVYVYFLSTKHVRPNNKFIAWKSIAEGSKMWVGPILFHVWGEQGTLDRFLNFWPSCDHFSTLHVDE